MQNSNLRIFFTGTGGQGTLTATRLLGEAALAAGVHAVVGEIHGMAQRGGVVESCLLLGCWQAPRIDHGEADILLGFELLETLRALPYLKYGGAVFSSLEQLPPLDVCLGKAVYPELKRVRETINQHAEFSMFINCHDLAKQAGNSKAANSVLLGCLCASGRLPFDLEFLEYAIETHLPLKIREVNLRAVRLGADAWRQCEE